MIMKQSLKIFFSFCAFSTLLLLGSCKKGWIDVNYDPRELTDTQITPDLMVAPVLEEPASFPPDFDLLAMWMGYWSPTAMGNGSPFTTYSQPTSAPGPTINVILLEQKATDLHEDFYTGIAKTVKALMFARAVDEVNNIPYTEAYRSDILRPKFDSGQSVYEDVMKQLTTASGLIKNADISKNPKLAVADIMFHGDKQKWLQFINTIKLRLLVHQANVPGRESYIKTEINNILAEGSGFLQSQSDAAVNPGYSTTVVVSKYYGLYDNNNFLWGGRADNFGSSIDYAHANVYGMNLLKDDNDPRLAFIYSPTDLTIPPGGSEPFSQPGPSNFRGEEFGLGINIFAYPYQTRQYLSAVGGNANTGIVDDTSSGIIKGNNMDGWVMTSIESYFLQAEAIYRGWLPGNAEQAYINAVKESFRWLNVGRSRSNPSLSDAIFSSWYNAQVTAGNPRVSWSAAPDKYKLLMSQKYTALNGIDPIESWTDYRRNGRYPDVPLSADPGKVANTLPIRFDYTPDSYSTNGANISLFGTVNVFTSKIWWMP